MNKFIAFGVAVLLCVAAAGFGAYLALRPSAATVSAPSAAGAGASSELAQAGAGAQTPPVTTTENVVTDPVLSSTPAVGSGTSIEPAPATTPAPLPGATPASKPSRKPTPANTADGAGATEPTPPASQNAGWTGVDKTWPSGNAGTTTPPTSAVPPPVPEPVAPPPPPQPPPRTFEELVVTADSVLGLRIDSTVSSEVARIEDPVEARVTRDVRVGDEVAIPSGTRVLGSVVQVERGGKMKTKARIGIRFHTLVMADGSRLTMSTEAVYREGKSPGQESAAKVGAAAVGGAILGAIVGGGKGAAIGGSIGAAGGSAAVMAGDRNPAVLGSGTAVTVRLQQPVTVTVERDNYRE
jgi:hypothetical protein